jgi:DNA-binding response OmpR family regulator
VIIVGDIEVDLSRWEARLGGRPVPLAAKGAGVAGLPDRAPRADPQPRQLVGGVWGQDWVGDERTVDVHVRQLRRRLGEGLPLTTAWGVRVPTRMSAHLYQCDTPAAGAAT